MIDFVAENPKLSYVVGSALVFVFIAGTDWSTSRRLRNTHLAIIGWSAAVYAAAFLVSDPLISPEIAYYVDWIVSTPLLLYALSLTTSGFGVQPAERNAILLQVGVIAAGYMTVESSEPLLWFGISTGLFLAMLQQVSRWRSLRAYPVLAGLLVVSWLAYPWVWWQTGGDLASAELSLVVLPFVSKHLFSVVDLVQAGGSR